MLSEGDQVLFFLTKGATTLIAPRPRIDRQTSLYTTLIAFSLRPNASDALKSRWKLGSGQHLIRMYFTWLYMDLQNFTVLIIIMCKNHFELNAGMLATTKYNPCT